MDILTRVKLYLCGNVISSFLILTILLLLISILAIVGLVRGNKLMAKKMGLNSDGVVSRKSLSITAPQPVHSPPNFKPQHVKLDSEDMELLGYYIAQAMIKELLNHKNEFISQRFAVPHIPSNTNSSQEFGEDIDSIADVGVSIEGLKSSSSLVEKENIVEDNNLSKAAQSLKKLKKQ